MTRSSSRRSTSRNPRDEQGDVLYPRSARNRSRQPSKGPERNGTPASPVVIDLTMSPATGGHGNITSMGSRVPSDADRVIILSDDEDVGSDDGDDHDDDEHIELVS